MISIAGRAEGVHLLCDELFYERTDTCRMQLVGAGRNRALETVEQFAQNQPQTGDSTQEIRPGELLLPAVKIGYFVGALAVGNQGASRVSTWRNRCELSRIALRPAITQSVAV